MGELEKMTEAFVVKCQGTQESLANLLTNCKMVPPGCQKGAKRVPEGRKGYKRAPTSATMSQGLFKRPPRGKIRTAVLGQI